MVARPGRRQAAFHSGELDPLLYEREELEVFGTGVAYAENVDIAPQGGFRQRDGLRDLGSLSADAARLFTFTASDGSAYDLAFRPGQFSAWGASGLLQTVSITDLSSAMLPNISSAQWLDTMLIFHPDFQTSRVKFAGPTSWSVDTAPFERIPTYDYGADVHGNPYTNGVASVWQLEFVGLVDQETVFILTVSGQDTESITYHNVAVDLAGFTNNALSSLPNLAAGYTVTVIDTDPNIKLAITFSGADNLGDRWAVSARIVNKDDAAVLSTKTTAGVTPGEPVFSADRGWPSCGAFYNQRTLLGGFRSLPNAWMFSHQADYYNFDDRFTDATGPALVPMDVPGGERIRAIVPSLDLVILTSGGEYWLADRALSKTQPPNHVQASTNGVAAGVPVVANEGALLYMHPDRGVLSEFRYTDTQGNFVSTDLSLFASHLFEDVVDLATRRGSVSTDGNLLLVVGGDGQARQATILRQQNIMGVGRFTSAEASFKAVAVNGRNEASWIVARPSGRRFERSEDNLLLDEAIDWTGTETKTITIARFANRTGIWAIADGDVFGPFDVGAGGVITLPVSVTAATIGSWSPPIVTTLPVSSEVGQNTVVKKRRRIHSVTLSVLDTTSVAIATNGGQARDIDLRRYGQAADVGELEAGYTGELTVRGLTGFAEQPNVTVTQLRPGRLNVRSITIETTS